MIQETEGPIEGVAKKRTGKQVWVAYRETFGGLALLTGTEGDLTGLTGDNSNQTSLICSKLDQTKGWKFGPGLDRELY